MSEGVVRRVARLAKPYRWMLIGFVAVIIVEALIALLPPLLFRSIIDTAIPDGNRAMLNRARRARRRRRVHRRQHGLRRALVLVEDR